MRDRPLRLPLRARTALPGMAVAYLLAGLAGMPVWVFALLSVLGVIWRAPPRDLRARSAGF